MPFKVTVCSSMRFNTESIMIQHLSGSHYIRYVFHCAFGFDTGHGFGSPPGIKRCPLENHGSQLKKERPESAFIS